MVFYCNLRERSSARSGEDPGVGRERWRLARTPRLSAVFN